jgi:hypothetical protein
MTMNLNPEFRRNLWLELTPYRLVGMPAVLATVFFLAYLLDDRELGDGVATTAVILFLLLAGLWGTKLSSEAVVAEIRDHTWDGQRMSVIGPWEMTWGKLLGSTIYPWYGASICLAVFAGSVEPPSQPLKMVILMAAAGLLAQSLGLLVSLMAIRKNRLYSRSQSTAFFVLGLAITSPLFSQIISHEVIIEWYGTALDRLEFLLLSVTLFVMWAAVGIYRLMRTELQLKNTPWLWCAFLIYLAGYMAGFIDATQGSWLGGGFSDRLFFSFGLMLAACYGMAFTERKDPVAFRRLIVDFKGHQWRHFLQSCPLWLATLPLVLLAGVALMATGYHRVGAGTFTMFVLAVICLLCRDLGLLLFFNLGRNPRRADWLMVLCLGLLYWIVPQILAILDFDLLTGLFWPRWDLPPVLTLGAAGVEAVAIGWLLVRRWQSTAIKAKD